MQSNKRNLIILFFTLMIMMLGFGIIIPILPFYIESMGASGSQLGLLMAVFAFMQLIFAPVWGGLSDKVGRKPILMVGVFGNAFALLLMGLATQMWMLFVARALAGVLSSATMPTAMAYIGDSTTPENRSGGMGVIGAAMGMGMVIGPGIGGWLADISLSTPFYFASALSVLVLIFIVTTLPESLAKSARTQDTKIQGPDFKAMWLALFGPLSFLLVLSFLISFGMSNFESIFGLFTLEKFSYGPKEVGTILVFIGLVSAMVQGGLTGRISKLWGDTRVVQGALVISAIGFVLMLLATDKVSVILTASFFMLGNSLLRPLVASLISKRSSLQEQGVALGLHNSFMSLGRIIGPTWAGFVFDANISYPYISGGVVMLLAFGATFIWYRQSKKPHAHPIIADEIPS